MEKNPNEKHVSEIEYPSKPMDRRLAEAFINALEDVGLHEVIQPKVIGEGKDAVVHLIFKDSASEEEFKMKFNGPGGLYEWREYFNFD